MTSRPPRNRTAPPDPAASLEVVLPSGEIRLFDAAFRIGRDADCAVRLDDSQISRRHASVTRAAGQWIIRDLQSSNGLFVDGAHVESAVVEGVHKVQLGADGPELQLSLEGHHALPLDDDDGPSETMILGHVEDRYFSTSEDDALGDHTIMIRRVYRAVQARQRRRFLVIVAVLALAALAATAYAYHQNRQLAAMQADARNRFYRLRRLEVQAIERSGQGAAQPSQLVAERQRLQKEYEDYVSSLYPRGLDAREKLILRVTRLFGECDVMASPEYIKEVSNYIQGWKSTGRFVRGVKRAQELGYTQRIVDAFVSRDLPPQFFYLALQESDFEPYVSGRWTRFGYAKGMWQFIPDTGRQYGLRIGPLEKTPAHDPEDDRQNWQKATEAAAKYIQYLYSKKTQASGLLVMASYNWGERRVIPLIDSLAENPSERNFWQLVERYKKRVPRETYDYVFSIVSAAVIGEDPGLFGFPITNPLEPYVGR